MPNVHQHLFRVTSNAGAAVNSDPFFVGSEPVWINFFLAPGNLCELQVSPDRVDWSTALDDAMAGITGLGAVNRPVASRGQWVRMQVATDAGGPRAFAGMLTVVKDD